MGICDDGAKFEEAIKGYKGPAVTYEAAKEQERKERQEKKKQAKLEKLAEKIAKREENKAKKQFCITGTIMGMPPRGMGSDPVNSAGNIRLHRLVSSSSSGSSGTTQ